MGAPDHTARRLFLPGRIFATYRTDNWWLYKIPPLAAVAYAMALVLNIEPARGFVWIGATVFVSLCSAAAFGHAVNDWTDIEPDTRAGKPNTMVCLPVKARLFATALPLATGLAPAFFLDLGALATVVLAVQFALPALYSVRPARLKERGVWGVVADGLGAHAVPSLFVVTALVHLAGQAPARAVWFGGFAVAYQLAAGLKGILSHQDQNRDMDGRAGERTFGASMPPEKVRPILLYGCYPLEMAGLAGVVAALAPVAPVFLVVTLAYAAMELSKTAIGWTVILGSGTCVYLPFINNFFYELAFPLALAADLTLMHPSYGAWVLVTMILFHPNISNQAAEARRWLAGLRQALSRRAS